jgi:hypothetical protein
MSDKNLVIDESSDIIRMCRNGFSFKSLMNTVTLQEATFCFTVFPLKLAITSLTSGGLSVGIVHSRTQTTEFIFFLVFSLKIKYLNIFVYKNSVRTSQETQYKRIMLFTENVAVYCLNRMKHANISCEQNAEYLDVKAGVTCTNRHL